MFEKVKLVPTPSTPAKTRKRALYVMESAGPIEIRNGVIIHIWDEEAWQKGHQQRKASEEMKAQERTAKSAKKRAAKQ